MQPIADEEAAVVVQEGDEVHPATFLYFARFPNAFQSRRRSSKVSFSVREENDWLPYFSTNPEATPREVLEAMADRGAEEQTFKDVKEVWGAGQQQVRNVYSNEGCFNLNLWLYSLVEAWAWNRPAEGLADRRRCPWDSTPRRPSHADKRKALQREVLQGEIHEALSGRPTKERIRRLAQRMLEPVP